MEANVNSNAAETAKLEVTLKDGRKAVIREGKGYDAEEAMRVSGSSDKADKVYISALMAQVVTIEGLGVPMEELQNLCMKDYIAIQSAFSQLNF